MRGVVKSKQIIKADFHASKWLGLFNELEESGRGQTAKAQDAYRKAETWLYRLNKLNGEA